MMVHLSNQNDPFPRAQIMNLEQLRGHEYKPRLRVWEPVLCSAFDLSAWVSADALYLTPNRDLEFNDRVTVAGIVLCKSYRFHQVKDYKLPGGVQHEQGGGKDIDEIPPLTLTIPEKLLKLAEYLGEELPKHLVGSLDKLEFLEKQIENVVNPWTEPTLKGRVKQLNDQSCNGEAF